MTDPSIGSVGSARPQALVSELRGASSHIKAKGAEEAAEINNNSPEEAAPRGEEQTGGALDVSA